MRPSPRLTGLQVCSWIALILCAATTPAALTSAPRLPAEPLGQCSRRTPLVISEIMARPPQTLTGTNDLKLEYIEFFNSRSEPEDLSGFRLSGSIDFTFPAGTMLNGRAFLLVARAPADLRTAYGLANVAILGPWDGSDTNGLPNQGGNLRLRHRTSAVLLEIPYSTQNPWPLAAGGSGHSLVLARPSYGEQHPLAWSASDAIGGSPGQSDPVTTDPLDGMVINEFLANTTPPLEDFVEIYNASKTTKDLSGTWLSDEPESFKFRVPDGVLVPPRGFVHFSESTLGFALRSTGERIFLFNPAKNRVLDVVEFGPQENGVASGRSPDGSPQIHRLTTPTPSGANASALASPIVITEILYHPLSGNDDEQFIELHNRTGQRVDLGGWRITDGVEYAFPPDTRLGPGDYLMVARNALLWRERQPALHATNCYGNFQGRLSHGGERLILTRPLTEIVTNAAGSSTNLLEIAVQEITYGTGGRWPHDADGGGSSLELQDPRANPQAPGSWKASDERGKAPWTLIERRGVVDNASSSADQLQVLLQGEGECLIDDVQVLDSNGVNLIPNSTFESGATGWTAQGTLSPSSLEPSEGFNSARSYRIRAVDRGDNQVNRLRINLTRAIPEGSVATLRARARWLRGHPGILLRLRGNGLEAAATLQLPQLPGTPAALNSTARPNSPPSIHSVAHSPILPAPGQSIIVTARIEDPDGIASATLHYRRDPSLTATALPLRDDGTQGDVLAGDGLFSATLPSQTTGTLVAFWLQAGDASPQPASTTFPSDAPARECLVRVGETTPAGDFPVYRLWMTQATLSAWDARNNLDNTPNDITFVLGNQRVIYNASALFAGSPYIAPGFNTPTGNRCGYSITFPPDDPFLGGEDLVLDWPGGHGGETTAIQEQMAYWMADRMNLPFSHRHFIRLHVNGVTDMQRGGVFEAILQPAGDFLRQWSPDDTDGDFYKIDRAFEFSDNSSRIADPMPRLQPFLTPNLETGGSMKKTERYRWTWLKRSYDDANDYSNLLALVDALNAPTPEAYTSLTEAMIDVEQWMGIFAFEHIINNFDSWGHIIGKNMYAYKPTRGRWQLYAFDLDWLMLVSIRYSSQYTATAGPLFNSDDPTVSRLYDHPPFRRAYFRAIKAAVEGPLVASLCEPVMDAKYAALLANGITLCDGSPLTNPSAVKTWFRERRAALQTHLAAVQAPFTVNSQPPSSTTSNLVTLSGTAPIEVATIRVDHVPLPVTWTTISNWTSRILLPAGNNTITVSGIDPQGRPVNGAQRQLTVVVASSAPAPEGWIVFNEIEPAPTLPDAGFVELHNRSSQFAFDLSGWRIDGLDYTFPTGSVMAPNSYLMLAKDPIAFTLAYGPHSSWFDQFNGRLNPLGEVLTLLVPAQPPLMERVVDQIRYGADAPWPSRPAGTSLQLIDASQDNAVVANWGIGESGAAPKPEWVQVIASGVATSSRLYIYLQSTGETFVDDLRLVAGSNPNSEPNLLANPGFESTLTGPWTLTANFSRSTLSTDVKRSGSSSLHVIATAGGTGSGNAIFQEISPALESGQPYTLSFWYLPTTNGSPLTIRLSGNGLTAGANTTLDFSGPSGKATPGRPNSVASKLPSPPGIWINEVLPSNSQHLTDSRGEHEPWIEIFNPTSQPVSLDELRLANSYNEPNPWRFPTGAVLAPGAFAIIFADGQPQQTSASEWHTPFRLNPTNGVVALSWIHDNQSRILDYLHYAPARTDVSLGALPDRPSLAEREFPVPTPGRSNQSPPTRHTVLINEWMADNAGSMLDPADQRADDWLELFNPNPFAVDLSLYSLTDDTNRWSRSPLPIGTTIPAHGFLLVWADGSPEQNNAAIQAVHAAFQLNKAGDQIALYDPQGQLVDTVSFTAQTADRSQGRYPDGAATILSLNPPTPGLPNRTDPNDPAPSLTAVIRSGELVFTWSAVADRTYQIEFKSNLDPGPWTVIATHHANNLSASMTLPLPSSAIGFYRISLLP